MLEFRRGNLLDADVDALVNTVNTVGVMGKGIALQFGKSFPEIMRPYKDACESGDLTIGTVQSIAIKQLGGPKYIINVPTKKHWKGDSKLEYVTSGLHALASEIRALGISSIAIPPLGCGLGGLKWADVRHEIELILGPLADVKIIVFEPNGAPAPHKMRAAPKLPSMTPGSAALLELMRRYLSALADSGVTLLESHKLMYFFEETGTTTQLAFVKGIYGPYSKNLRHVLSKLEGHFIIGFGDASEEPGKMLEPQKGAMEAAKRYFATDTDAQRRLERVAKLIDGFETAFGMELIATVHWVAKHEPSPASTPEEAVRIIHEWNPRKRSLFAPDYVRLAWDRLTAHGWL